MTSSSSPEASPLGPLTRTGRTNVRFEPLRIAFDQDVSPSLAVKAILAQQLPVFINYIMASWPCYFKYTERLVPVNWVEYVHNRSPNTPNSSFDIALCSLTVAYTGHATKDDRLMHAGRTLYGQALRSLAGRLKDTKSAMNDEVLATAILLGVYEIFSCTSPRSWLQHYVGIVQLMKLRGAESHRAGFGRAMYVAYRTFLVTGAFAQGEACFLEEPEWQSLSETIAAESAKLPDSSVLTEIIERAFRGVVRIPGYVRRLRDLWGQTGEPRLRERTALVDDMVGTRATLRGIHTEFGIAVVTQNRDPDAQFVGPIPFEFFDGFSSFSLKGIRSAIIRINQMLLLLDPYDPDALLDEMHALSPVNGPRDGDGRDDEDDTMSSSRSPEHPAVYRPNVGPIDILPRRDRRYGHRSTDPVRISSRITPELKRPPTIAWVDSMATTLGMSGIQFGLIDDEEHPGEESPGDDGDPRIKSEPREVLVKMEQLDQGDSDNEH